MDSLFHVAVGSTDTTKVAAVRKAFFSAFPTQTAIISRHDEATGPPPAAWAAKGLSGDAMRRVGAVKAAYAALSANPIASYGVGLVPGVADTAGDGAERIGSVVVVSRDGRESHARTASVPLPPRVARLLRGQEPGHGALGLEAAVDVAMKDSERSGVVAKLTRGLLSAESYWEQAVICCLTTFLHDESGLYKTLPQSSAALVRDRETRDAAAAAGPAATDDGDDSDGFEMLGTSTLAQREAEARDRAIRGEGEVISVDDDGDDDAVKSQKLRSALKLLAHATKCAGCDSTNCVKMKKILMHALMCKTRPISGCMLCRQAYGVLQLHAVHCTAAPGACRVPKCQEFKQMLAAMPTAQSTKIASKFAL